MFKTALKIKKIGYILFFVLTFQKAYTFGASSAMVSEDRATNNEPYRR